MPIFRRLFWQSIVVIVVLVGVQIVQVQAGIVDNPAPLPGWTHTPAFSPADSPQRHGILLSGLPVVQSSPVIADIDNQADHKPEVLVGGADGILYAYRSDGSLLWSRDVMPAGCSSASARISSSPSVGAIFGNGIPYVVVSYGTLSVSDCDGGVVVYRGSDGVVAWRFSLRAWAAHEGYTEALYGVISSPALADTDGDGRMEIGFGGLDRNVYLLNADGTPRWYYNAIDTSWSSPVFADVEGDGRLEMIAATDITANPSLIPPTQDGGFVHAFRTEQRSPLRIEYNAPGAFMWRTFFDQVIYSSPVIADFLPASSGVEIAVGSGCYFPLGSTNKRGRWVKILRLADGAVLQTLNAPFCFSSSIAAGDIDDDGQLEIVATVNGDPNTDNLGRVVAWDPTNSTPKWSTVPYNPNSAPNDPVGNDEYGGDMQSALIADVDGNGSLEVIAANFWAVHILRGTDGVPLTCQSTSCGTQPSLFAWGTLKSTPAIADINGDGFLDIVIGGMHIFNGNKGMFYAWSYLARSIVSPVGSQPHNAAPWPMFRRDAAHSGTIPLPPPDLPLHIHLPLAIRSAR